ncbi:MAG: ATP-binding cassette domain-containing protein [Marinifilaceae bacterium]
MKKDKKQKTIKEITQQRLHSIDFELLKNIRNVNFSIEPNNVTGIFGINGCGKSTLIHAIACLYKPTDSDKERKNHKFSSYFTPTTHSAWKGSLFTIEHSYRKNGKEVSHEKKEYRKDDSRWAPQYSRRPERDVYFIGIDTSVPDIEKEKTLL